MKIKYAKKLNFGAGSDIREEWDNIDKEDFNFNKFPYPIKDNTYDFVEARQVLQLMDYPEKVLQELHRITKKDGTIKLTVSHYNNKGSHNDIKTKFYFNENSFKLFQEWNKDKFEILSLELEPTWIGRFLIFEWVKKTLNLFIGGIYSHVIIEFRVLK